MDLILQAERVLGHDRSYFLRLCAWCNRAGGSCDHRRELLAQATGRFKTLRRPIHVPWRPWAGPWFPLVRNVGLSRLKLVPAAFMPTLGGGALSA